MKFAAEVGIGLAAGLLLGMAGVGFPDTIPGLVVFVVLLMLLSGIVTAAFRRVGPVLWTRRRA